MELIGKIKLITETKTYGNNGFRKREIVVTTDEQYPQHILVEFVQDKCDLLDAFKVEQEVKIAINLRGREWMNQEGIVKYFNSIQGWKIEQLNTNFVMPANNSAPLQPFSLIDEEDDGLPF